MLLLFALVTCGSEAGENSWFRIIAVDEDWMKPG